MVRKESWALSLRGKLIVLGVVAICALAAQGKVEPFLAITQRVDAKILVVEGWVPTYVMNQAAAEFKRGHYRKLLIVRTFDVEQYESEWHRAELVENGVPPEALGMVFSPAVRKDRTYHAALKVKDWFTQNGMFGSSFNVATLGPHARRSWLSFQEAFGDAATVGIIALDDPAYDPEHWWRSSEGVREVLGESIAYIYARFFFAWN